MSVSSNGEAGNIRGIDAAIALVSCGLLFALLVPAIAQSNANSDRINCLNHATRIAQGLFDYHDAHRHFPTASTQLITAKPAHFSGDGDSAGYSWLVKILPSVGESAYYDALVKSSKNFTKHLFDPAVTSDGLGNVPSRTHLVAAFMCPSFGDHVRSRAQTLADLPAISNYHAMSSTHFYNKQGIGRLDPPERFRDLQNGRVVPSGFEGNGAIPFPGYFGNEIIQRGLNLSAVSDGSSRTILYAETIERQFAGWMDGQVTWLVAAWPSNPGLPAGFKRDAKSGYQYFSGWTDEQLSNNWTSIAKSASRNGDVPIATYFPSERWSGKVERTWGPSSYHDGVVTHVFADGHGKLLSVDIDKNVYLYLVTRNGRETTPDWISDFEKGAILRGRD